MQEPSEFRETGLFPGVLYEAYHAWPGINKSHLWLLNELTPLHYKDAIDHPEPLDLPAYRKGRAAHFAVLEPDTFELLYVVRPATHTSEKGEEKPWNSNAKVCRAWLAEQSEKGLLDLRQEEFDAACFMRDAVWAHPDARWILEHAEIEPSLQWHDLDTGLLLKGRPDLWVAETGVLADLKTTRCASAERFGRDAYRLGYPFQLAFYHDGLARITNLEIKPPVIIAVENHQPWAVVCFDMQSGEMPWPLQLELGRSQYQIALRRVKDCMEAEAEGKPNAWPGYEQGLLPLLLPSWAGQEIGA